MFDLVVFQIIAMGFYLLFVFFSFCDGFNIHITRKILWAIVFVVACYVSFLLKGSFDFLFILPIASVLAFFFCWNQKKIDAKKG